MGLEGMLKTTQQMQGEFALQVVKPGSIFVISSDSQNPIRTDPWVVRFDCPQI